MEGSAPAPPIGRGQRLRRVVALWEYAAMRSCELSFEKQESLEVVRTKKSGWMIARNAQGQQGEVPMNYFSGDALTEIPDCTDEVLDQDEHDDEYFRSYGQNMHIHWEMLSDASRTIAYRDALTQENVRGKIVLDVGCGTGILSLFCARAGAKKVFAVDASDMAAKTRQIVAMNGFSDVIEVIQGSISDVILPYPVDIIVSEWMGTMLLFEGMLEDVIFARDKWLQPDGVMYPTWAAMYLAGVSLPELWQQKVGLWDDVYGFDMKVLKDQTWAHFFERPVISEFVTGDKVITPVHEVAVFDLKTTTIDELQAIRGEIFGSSAVRDGQMHAILNWFDVGFGDIHQRAHLAVYPPAYQPGEPAEKDDSSQPQNAERQAFLSTSPWSPETHWRHALLMFKEPCGLRRGDKVNIALDMRKNPDLPRHYHVELGVENESASFAFAKMYPLWA